jgi:hypothetical protein
VNMYGNIPVPEPPEITIKIVISYALLFCTASLPSTNLLLSHTKQISKATTDVSLLTCL